MLIFNRLKKKSTIILDLRRIIILKLTSEFIITPRILFRDKNLSKTDIVVLSLIISLALKYGYCYATNDYLKEYINSSERTINYSLSKLKKLDYIIVKFDNSKRRIYLNMEKVPTKVADEDAENCSNEVASSCTYNINNSKYKNNNKRKEILPYWMEHPEICVSEPLSDEEQKEMDELMKDFK